MAQNISLWGASYSAVPSIQLPKTGGGTASFDDTTDANATAADITTGKTAYVNGVKLIGTNSGGGGTDPGYVWQDAQGYVHLSDEPGSTVLIPKSITANGTYNASDDSADGYSSVTVNVSGGGGSDYEFLGSDEFTVSTTSTSITNVGTITISGLQQIANLREQLIYVKIRDKNGKRDGYFYGTDTWMLGNQRTSFTYRQDTQMQTYGGSFGVFPDSTISSSKIQIASRYNSTYSKTIDSDYVVEVYALNFPNAGDSPYV